MTENWNKGADEHFSWFKSQHRQQDTAIPSVVTSAWPTQINKSASDIFGILKTNNRCIDETDGNVKSVPCRLLYTFIS